MDDAGGAQGRLVDRAVRLAGNQRPSAKLRIVPCQRACAEDQPVAALHHVLFTDGKIYRVSTLTGAHKYFSGSGLDLGKLLFTFVVFWTYTNFSQYMLIWYANLPEETMFYQMRKDGGWSAVGTLLVFGHFFVPFLTLLNQDIKRKLFIMFPMAAWAWFRPVGRRSAAGGPWRQDVAVASNTERLGIPQPRRKGGNVAKF